MLRRLSGPTPSSAGRDAARRSSKLYGELGLPGAACAISASRSATRQAESGELNTVSHHVWVYASAADREAKRAEMAQDPDWKIFLAENAKAGNLVSQRTC